MPSTTPTPLRLAPLDDLARAVQLVLRTDPPEPGGAHGPSRFAAHGYAATEAYFHLARLAGADLRSMRIAGDPAPHWFLLDDRNQVIDLSLGHGERSRTGDVDYAAGVRRGFRWTRHGPSARARHIMERVDPGSVDALLRRQRA